MSEINNQEQLKVSLENSLGNKISFLTPHAWSPYGLTIEVNKQEMLDVFTKLKNDDKFLFNMLVDVTCVDWLDSRPKRFEIVYQLLSLTYSTRLTVKVQTEENDPAVFSVRELWDVANFLEREVWDMYGVNFIGHGDLRRILMYDEFVGHPLRKDYPLRGKQPRVKLRVPELRNTSADLHRKELTGGELVAMPTKRQAQV